MKTHQALVIVIIVYTSHVLPTRNHIDAAQNVKKRSSPKFLSLTPTQIGEIRQNMYEDPSSKIKKQSTGKSRITNAAKKMQLTNSKISEIQKNYNASFTDTKIKRLDSKETNPVHGNISGRSGNHNESTSDIHIWSSNSLTKEQWEIIRKNIEENKDLLKYDHEDVKSDIDENYNHTSESSVGRNRNVNTKHDREGPKYYSFSENEWEELKQTLHKHLIGEDEKILQINKESTKNTPQGRGRNEKNESPSIKKWSDWNTYALKPSEWNQLKVNILANELIMNKTENNIGAIGQGRSNKMNSKSNDYDKNSSAMDNINVVIVKPVTGEQLYNLKKHFEWDKLLESIGSMDTSVTNEDKDGISKVNYSDDYNTQSYDQKEKTNETSQISEKIQLGRRRNKNNYIGRGIIKSPMLDDDDDLPFYDNIAVQPTEIASITNQDNNFNIQNANVFDTEQTEVTLVTDSNIEYANAIIDSTVVDFETHSPKNSIIATIITTTEEYISDSEFTENSSSQFRTENSPDHLSNINNTKNSQGLTDSPGNTFKEINDTKNTVTISPTYLNSDTSDTQSVDNYSTENIMMDFSTTARVDYNASSLQSKHNTSKENYLSNSSLENYQITNNNSTVTITLHDNTIDSEEYDTTESIQYESNDNSTGTITLQDITIDSEEHDTTESIQYEPNSRENYIKIKTENDSLKTFEYTMNTQNKDTDIYHPTSQNYIFTTYSLSKDETHYTTTTQDITTNALTKDESEDAAIYHGSNAEDYIITSSKNDFMSTDDAIDNFENTNSIYYTSTISEAYGTTPSTNDSKNDFMSTDDAMDTFKNTSIYYRSTISEEYGATPSTNDTKNDFMSTDDAMDTFKNTSIYYHSTVSEDYGAKHSTNDTKNDFMSTDDKNTSIYYHSTISEAYVTTPSTNDTKNHFMSTDDSKNTYENTNIIYHGSTLSKANDTTPSSTVAKDFFMSTADAMDTYNNTNTFYYPSTISEAYITTPSTNDTKNDFMSIANTMDNYENTNNIHHGSISQDSGITVTIGEINDYNSNYNSGITVTIDEINDYNPNYNSGFTLTFNDIYSYNSTTKAANKSNITNSVMDPSTPTDSGFSGITDENGYPKKEDRFNIPEGTPGTTEALQEIGNFGEITIPTTDIFDNDSEDIEAVTLNSYSGNDNLLTDLEINNGTTNKTSVIENTSPFNDLNDKQSFSSVTESQEIEFTEVPNSNYYPNQAINSTTGKLANALPNQPQELVGNEIPTTSTTVSHTTVTPTPAKPAANKMETWIILVIVCALSLVFVAAGIVLFVRLRGRQHQHFQLTP